MSWKERVEKKIHEIILLLGEDERKSKINSRRIGRNRDVSEEDLLPYY
jgi:hypothetical protein